MITETVKLPTAKDTENLGERIGRLLKGGEVIELISDVGGGKTTFVRGLARGAGSPDVVGSPTFTLSKVYRAPNLEIHHFDFYRLSEAGLMQHELHDLIGDPTAVVVVEWGDVVQHVLPVERMSLVFRKTSDSEARQVDVEIPETLSYLWTPR